LKTFYEAADAAGERNFYSSVAAAGTTVATAVAF